MRFFIKMKKELFEEIEIPEGVEANIDSENSTLTVKGSEGEISEKFKIPKLKFEIKDKKIRIGSKNSTKKEKRLMNTIAAHIRNMVKGVQEKFEYKLKICASHFPMSVDIQGREVIVKNFLGEKIPRKTKIPEDVEIKKIGDELIITAISKEKAGNAATKIESITRTRNKDKRIFQDGIYLTEKAGRKI